MTPTETRKSSGSTDRDRDDQDQLLARLRQYSMTSKLAERGNTLTTSAQLHTAHNKMQRGMWRNTWKKWNNASFQV